MTEEISVVKSRKSDTDVLMSYYPVPGYGLVAVNAYLIHSKDPVLVDTGIVSCRESFSKVLNSIINPHEIRWVYLTHTDPDHIGNLRLLLDKIPNARIVTTFIGMAKLDLNNIPLDRVYLLNPGQSLSAGDREFICIKPPTYDAPETTGLFDSKTKTLFSADCFGAIISRTYRDVAEIPQSELRNGLITWATIDAPWLKMVDRASFQKHTDEIRLLKPERILSSHLPPAESMTDLLIEYLRAACTAEPFVGPDQAALEKLT